MIMDVLWHNRVLARLAAPLALLKGSFNCRICRRTAGYVFLSIIAVEAAVLVPSYRNYERDLLLRLESAGRAEIRATYRGNAHARERDLLTLGRLLTQGSRAGTDRISDAPIESSHVRGGRLHRPDGSLIGSFGDPPELTLEVARANDRWKARSADGQSYDMVLTADQTGLPMTIVARLDSSWIEPELKAFVWRIVGLVLLISVFVCAITMAIIGRSILVPLLRLRTNVSAARDDPANADRYVHTEARRDELGELIEAVNRLLYQVSSHLELQENELASTAEHLTAVLDTGAVGIISINANGLIQSFNPAAESLFGYTAEEAVSQNVSMLMPEPYRHDHDTYVTDYVVTGEAKIIGTVREVVARHRDGHIFPAELSLGQMMVYGEMQFVGFITDITERKQAEDALKASEQRFRDVADVAVDWIWETDRENRYTYFSDQMEKITGLAAKDLIGKTRRELPWVDSNHPRWLPLYETVAAHRPFRDFCFEVRKPGNKTIHLRIGGKPIFDSERNFEGYRGTGTNVTAQIEAEAEAARKTDRLHATFDNMGEGIIVADGDGRIAAFNARFRQLFDLPAGTVAVGMPFEQIVRLKAERGEYGPGDVDELTRRRIERTHTGQSQVDEHTRPDGTILERRGNSLPGGGFVITFVDITDRKRIEEEYRQAQKMEAIGRLTGGVAHEFNNLLTAIGGFAHLVKRRADDPEIVREWSEEIIGAADQAATLTSQLLAFSRKQILEPKVVGIGKVLEETEILVRPLLGGSITARIDAPEEETCVKVDPGRLSQALLNLAINAQDAMPDGGTLSISSRLADLDETSVAGFDQAEPGRYVAIAVKDTGTGIDEQTREQIFEPFFTTKEIGKGTGLGLSMVYGMVQQSGGVITVHSEIGRGATFTIYLPLVDAAQIAIEMEAVGESAPGGSETVLLAEDEVAVRQLARITLEGLGYTVLPADSGLKAVEIFRDHDGRIDLLLADLRMPELDGRQLARMLMAESPDLAVLFITGHDEGATEGNNRAPADSAVVLRKSFDPDRLARAVRGVLDAADRSSAA